MSQTLSSKAMNSTAIDTQTMDAKTQLIETMHQVLNNTLNCPHMNAFSPQARLNEDLYLDSVMLLQLLLQLELEHGYQVPDEALNKEAFATVEGLAQFLLRVQSSPHNLSGGTA